MSSEITTSTGTRLVFGKRAPIYLLAFLGNMGYGVVIPVLSLYAASLGSSYSLIGMIISTYAVAQLIMQVPMGRISDRVGRKILITIGFIGAAVAAALYNLASQPSHFFILQAIAGLSMGCVWSPMLAQLTGLTPPGERGKVMGIFNTVFFVGLGLGPLLGGYVSTAYGFLAAFNFWALISGVGALSSLLILKETPRAAEAPASVQVKKEPARLIKSDTLPTFLATCAIRSRGGLCTSFNNALMPLYAVTLFSASQSMIGGLMFIHGIALAVFNFPGGVASDRWGRKLPIIVGSLIASMGVLWYYFSSGYWVLFVAVALAGAGGAFAVPGLTAVVGDVSNPSRRGEAFGFLLTSFHLGTVLGALVFGFISDLVGLRLSALAWGGLSLAISFSGFVIRDTVISSKVKSQISKL